MNYEDFISLGFNVNEAKVYETLLRYKKADAKTLIKELGMHKNIIYDNLHKLLDKGLLATITEDKRQLFIAEDPHALQEFLSTKQVKLNEQKEKAETLINEIRDIQQKTPEQEEASILRGQNGVRAIFKELITCKEYVAFGAPKESEEIMGEAFWKNWHLRQQEANITCKMIFNETLRPWATFIKQYPNEEIRFLEQSIEPLTETIIWKNTTAIIVWTKKPITTIIRNNNVAKSYKNFFDIMWKTAKK